MIKGLGWTPDVIHCNDWQTALLPVMLRTDDHMRYDAILQGIRVMYTIHNMAYQGMFPATTASDLGFGPELFQPGALEFYGQLNFMKGGLLFSDILTTVSPTYAREIQTPEFGCGLEGVLADKADRLHGIINGIDYNQWNPESDPHLPAHFSADDMLGKRKCKAALQNELGLTENPDVPLLVMISRLDPQKGLDILLPLVEPLLQRKLQLAILGTGLPEYHQLLEAAAAKHRGSMAVKLKFDNGLAHRMEAGGDVFLMPSRYEPCGLNQLYSLRYGTVPVVRMTGGLADSVQQISADGTKGTGFVFAQYSPAAFLQSIDDCLAAYARPENWRQIQLRGMGRNFSWEESARHYASLYAAMAI
jgi:starch synthase